MPAIDRRAASLAGAFAVLAFSVTAAFAGNARSDDEVLFGHALTAERGERLRLAAALDPQGWPALRALAHEATSVRDINPAATGMSVGRPDPAVLTAIARIDGTIAKLAARLRPELRRAPLDALEVVARAELKLLRASEIHAARSCAEYLRNHASAAVMLRYASRAESREVELARLRAIAAARAVGAVSPAYRWEQVSQEQEQLRDAGLTSTEIATIFAESISSDLKSPTVCGATIRYIQAVLDYPATLKATVLAYRTSGDYGHGAEERD